MKIKRYFLDPDNNKKDPESGLFCARCKRKFKPVGGHTIYSGIIFHKNAEYPWFRLSGPFERQDAMIGQDCLDHVIKEFGEQNKLP